ncbi:MAG TPA: hypothetical protein VJM51_03950 [Dehalococcoidia bacterium]|nr:hypothetical protein [Dehalococcoidia bacterium]
MFRSTLWVAVIAIGAALFVGTGSPALAIFPKLQTELSGPAIGGVIPEGDARVDQSGLPQVPGQLEL